MFYVLCFITSSTNKNETISATYIEVGRIYELLFFINIFVCD